MLTVLSTRTPDGGPCEGTLPLDGLLRFRESGGTSHTCLECQTTHDVSELLAGFTAPPLPPLHTDLRQLRHEVRAGRGAATATATILDEIRRHQEHAAEAADAIRRVIKALAGDVADCPGCSPSSRATPAPPAGCAPGGGRCGSRSGASIRTTGTPTRRPGTTPPRPGHGWRASPRTPVSW